MNDLEKLISAFDSIGDHYKDSLLEPLDVMKDWFTPEEYRGFLKGCVLKRIKRWKMQNGPRDLGKMLKEVAELVDFVNNSTKVL